MSQVIDERIVSMVFDNKDFERGVHTSERSLKSFDDQLSRTGSTPTHLAGLSSVVDGVSNRFTALGTIATGALLSIGARATQLAENLVRSIAIEPITQGYSEYELKINSIKTMLASGKDKEGLPVTLEMVNEQLASLNEYSDKTIYSFADMTQNIGKFTNAGVDLETSVQAIKGIANAAALAGSNSEQASHAMYNFAQALSAGYVKRIDWMSIETAGMATVEFKQQLLDAAVAAGTLEKTSDGMYKVLTTNAAGTTMKTAIDATTDFNDSLQYQWMTTTALTDVLSDYADETTEIGKKATESATKVRTFSQLMDTMKEAVGSGWAQSFELLIGDYDKATDRLTWFSDTFGKIIQDSSNARNAVIKDFVDLGGSTYVFETLQEIIKAVIRLSDAMGIAFGRVFGDAKPLGKVLADIALKVVEAAESFNFWVSKATNFSKIAIVFQGFFSAASLGIDVLKLVGLGFKVFFKEVAKFLPAASGLESAVMKIAVFFIQLRHSTEDGFVFEKKAIQITLAIKTFVKRMANYANQIKDSEFAKRVIEMFDSLKSLKFSMPALGGSGASNPIEALKNMLQPLLNLFEQAKPTMLSLKEWFIPIWDELTSALSDTFKATSMEELLNYLQKFLTVLFTGGLMAGLLSIVKSFSDISKGAKGMMDGITGILDGAQGALQAYQNSLNAKALMEIAKAVGLLTISLIALALIDSERLKKATLAISVLFLELGGSMAVFEKTISMQKMGAIAVALVGLATSILIISGAIAMLSVLDPDGMERGVLAITAVMALISTFILSTGMTSGKSVMASASSLIVMAGAMALMTAPIYLLGRMDPKKIEQGLKSMAAIFAEVIAYSLAMARTGSDAKGKLAAAATLIGVAKAMNKLGIAVSAFGGLSGDKAVQGVLAAGAMLGMITATLKVLGTGAASSMMGAAAMIAVATAINLITPALIALGSVPFVVVVGGLLALAGVFAIIGAAAYLLTPAAPSILAIAAGLALLGGAVFLVSAGIGAAAGGIALLVGAIATMAGLGPEAIENISKVLGELGKMLPYVMGKVAEGFVELAKVIRDGAPIIASAFFAILQQWTILFVEYAPELVKALYSFITLFMQETRAKFPEWVRLGLEMLAELLKGVKQNLPQIINDTNEIIVQFLSGLAKGLPDIAKAGADLVIAYLKAIADESPEVVDQAFKTLIAFVNGLADAIRENTPELIESGINLMTAFIDGVLEYLGISNGESEEGKKISESIITGLVAGLNPLAAVAQMLVVGKEMVDAIKEYLGINSPSTVLAEIAGNMIAGLTGGFRENMYKAIEEAEFVLDAVLIKILDYVRKFEALGENLTTSIATGIGNKIDSVVRKVTELGDKALEVIGWVWDMNSPSKKFIQVGEYAGEGMAIGFGNSIKVVGDSIAKLGNNALDIVASTSSKIANALSTELDTKPTITPVIDMSQLQNGARSIADMFNNSQTVGLAVNASTQARAAALLQNGSGEVGSTTTSIVNQFDVSGMTVRSDADIETIAQKLYTLQEQALRGRGIRSTALSYS